MKIRNLILLFVCCLFSFYTQAQDNVVKINCPDSLGFLTNLDGATRACEFYFHSSEEIPDMYYVENFSHQDFYDLIFNKDKTKISKVKLVRQNHIAAIHDFIYCYNKDNKLLYYYILKDRQEEKQLAE